MHGLEYESCKRKVANFLRFKVAVQLLEARVLLKSRVQFLEYQQVAVQILFVDLETLNLFLSKSNMGKEELLLPVAGVVNAPEERPQCGRSWLSVLLYRPSSARAAPDRGPEGRALGPTAPPELIVSSIPPAHLCQPRL